MAISHSREKIMANSTTESRNKAYDAAGKAQDATGRAVEAGREAAGTVADKAREAASSVSDKARDVATEAARAGQHAAQAVGHAADAATGKVGEGMQSLGQTVRQHGPDQGMWGSAKESVASSLEQGGRYLEQEGLSGMADDVTNLIKRNPIPAMLVGIGIGFLLARVTSRS